MGKIDVHLKGLGNETFLVTCLLEKNMKEKKFEIFERLPGNL